MASYTTSEIRGGLKVLLDGDPYTVIENEFVKPGKGQAFNRIKVRNLKTGRTIERTFRSGESLEAADVVDTEMQYLYQDGDFWHFMVPESFEQYTAEKAAVGDNAQWLKDGIICIGLRQAPYLDARWAPCVSAELPAGLRYKQIKKYQGPPKGHRQDEDHGRGRGHQLEHGLGCAN